MHDYVRLWLQTDHGSATLILYTIYTTYRELEGAVSVDSDSKDPLLTNVNNKFIN